MRSFSQKMENFPSKFVVLLNILKLKDKITGKFCVYNTQDNLSANRKCTSKYAHIPISVSRFVLHGTALSTMLQYLFESFFFKENKKSRVSKNKLFLREFYEWEQFN